MKIGSAAVNATKMKVERVAITIISYGEALEGEQKGETIRQTYQTISVSETTPSEVYGIIFRALEAASNKDGRK